MRAKPILLSTCAALALGLSFLSAPALAASEMEELAATLHPGDFSPRVEQLLTNGHPAQALELADIGIKRNPRNAQLQFLRTVSLESLGRTEDAAKGLKSLIAAYPEIPEPYNNLAVIEAGFGNLEEAQGFRSPRRISATSTLRSRSNAMRRQRPHSNRTLNFSRD